MPSLDALKSFSADDLLRELRAREHNEQPRDAEGFERTAAVELNEVLREYDSPTLAKALREMQTVIYESDDRQDLFEVNDQAVLAVSRGVVALVWKSALRNNGNGTSTLTTESFGASKLLCRSEAFFEQPIAAFCTGFLVAPDVVATAGHCVTAENVTEVRFVFGFRMIDARHAHTTISNEDIYAGFRVIDRRQEGAGADWALVQLDRAAPSDKVVSIRRQPGRIAGDQQVYVIGHPCGLPTKYAAGARVRFNENAAFFVANLDTYGGNSGSPVFNAETNEVEGVLVRGETDFVSQGNCNVSLVCPAGASCRGEDCTRVSEFAGMIPH